MTPSEEIRRATDKLLHVNTYVELWVEVGDQWTDDHADLKHELAALIRKAAEPQDTDSLGLEHSAGWCVICGGPANGHRSDCALLALVRAINGDQT